MRIFPSVSELRIVRSPRVGKRFRAIFTYKGKQKTVDFGQRGAYTYFDGADAEKRRLYRARASKITNAAGRFTYKIPATPNSFAFHILW